MSSVSDNHMGPVQDATPEIEAIADRPEVKHAAIHQLHVIHRNNEVHNFIEADKEHHVLNWKVIKHAEEIVSYGINYFMKIHIGTDDYIHIRVHRQHHHNIYDFYSLHHTIKHNVETCIWRENDPLDYFNS